MIGILRKGSSDATRIPPPRHIRDVAFGASTNTHFVSIPAGAVIETTHSPTKPGLHRISFNGIDLLVFTRDTRERTEVEEATAR